jgi:hypothetical protein
MYIFRGPISRPNIIYSITEYKEDIFRRGAIIIARRLVEQKLDEYPAPAKVIIYSSSILITQKVS